MKVNKGIIFFLYFVLFVNFSGVSLAQISGINPPDVGPERRIWYPEEFALYKTAFEKTMPLSKPGDNFYRAANDIFRTGWRNGPEVEALLDEYKEALGLFKQAAMQESDGTIFGIRPQVIDIHTEIPQFSGSILLLRLVLLEAKKLEALGDFSQAEHNYLAAGSFLLHLGRQDFKQFLTDMIQNIASANFLIAVKSSIIAEDFSDEYQRKILKLLNSIIEHQDFMRESIKLEAAFLRSSIDAIEDRMEEFIDPRLYEKDADIILVLNRASRFNESQRRRYLSLLRGNFETNIDALFDLFALSSQTNNPELLDREIQKRTQNMEGLRKLGRGRLSLWRHYLAQRLKGKSSVQVTAEIIAEVLAFVAIPQYTGAINAYHENYNGLTVLTTTMALRLYQTDKGVFPDRLGQLVPAYLNRAPEDTYNDFNHLQYRRENGGFVVYSFGPDREDGRGKISFWETGKYGDILFRYP